MRAGFHHDHRGRSIIRATRVFPVTRQWLREATGGRP